MTKDELRDVVDSIDVATDIDQADFLDELLEYVWCNSDAQNGGGTDPLEPDHEETDGEQNEDRRSPP